MSDINKKLIEARKTMVNPLKDSIGQIGKRKYSYATLDSLIEIICKALQEQNLFLTQGVENGHLVTKVLSAESSITLDARPMLVTTDPQAYGSYETYMRRYALQSVFGLVGESDDDGSKASDRVKQDNMNALVEACNKYAAAFGTDENVVLNQMLEGLKNAPESTWKSSINNLYQQISQKEQIG